MLQIVRPDSLNTARCGHGTQTVTQCASLLVPATSKCRPVARLEPSCVRWRTDSRVYDSHEASFSQSQSTTRSTHIYVGCVAASAGMHLSDFNKWNSEFWCSTGSTNQSSSHR